MNIVKTIFSGTMILAIMTLYTNANAEECKQPSTNNNISFQQTDQNDPSSWFDELAKNG